MSSAVPTNSSMKEAATGSARYARIPDATPDSLATFSSSFPAGTTAPEASLVMPVVDDRSRSPRNLSDTSSPLVLEEANSDQQPDLKSMVEQQQREIEELKALVQQRTISWHGLKPD